MASLDMSGPYGLSHEMVNAAITETSPGNYALGYCDHNRTFVVQYVGRSDSDVKARLHDWVGQKYECFMYSYASSAMAAFEKECRDYHAFEGSGTLENEAHPERPSGTDSTCPVCGFYGPAGQDSRSVTSGSRA